MQKEMVAKAKYSKGAHFRRNDYAELERMAITGNSVVLAYP